MSETEILKVENPIERLHRILTNAAALSTGKQQVTSVSAWAAVLEIENPSDQSGVRGMFAVRALCDVALEILRSNNMDHLDQITNSEAQLPKLISPMNPQQSWAHTKGLITPALLLELKLHATNSRRYWTVEEGKVFSHQDAVNLLKSVDTLRNEFLGANLSAELKTLVLRNLAEVRNALELYTIVGPDEFVYTHASAAGILLTHSKEIEESVSDTESAKSWKQFTTIHETYNKLVGSIKATLPLIEKITKMVDQTPDL